MDDLLEMLMQGAQQQPGSGSSKPTPGDQNPWSDMLESFLGGSAQPQQQTGSMGGISDLLESFLGGGGQQANVGANPLLAPFTDSLAEKLGISHQMAAVIISFAFSLLMSKLSDSGAQSSGDTTSQSPQGGFDLDDLLDDDYLDSKGITAQLSEQTGLDDDEARESLRTAVAMLNGQISDLDEPAPPPTQDKPSDLQDLLDTWEE